MCESFHRPAEISCCSVARMQGQRPHMGKQNVQDNNTGGRWGLQGGGNDLRSLTHDLDRSNKDTSLKTVGWRSRRGGQRGRRRQNKSFTSRAAVKNTLPLTLTFFNKMCPCALCSSLLGSIINNVEGIKYQDSNNSKVWCFSAHTSGLLLTGGNGTPHKWPTREKQ